MRTGFAADIIIGLAFAVLGAAIIVIASGFRTLPGMVVGSGLFPTVTGVAMGVFGLVMAFGAARAARRSEPDLMIDAPDPGHRDTAREDSRPLFDRYAIAVIVALVVLILAMPTAGFLAAGFAFSVFAVRLGGGRWTGAVVFAAIVTVSVHLVFTQGLRVPLPSGPF